MLLLFDRHIVHNYVKIPGSGGPVIEPEFPSRARIEFGTLLTHVEICERDGYLVPLAIEQILIVLTECNGRAALLAGATSECESESAGFRRRFRSLG